MERRTARLAATISGHADANGAVSRVETDIRGIVIATSITNGTEGGQTTAIDYAFYESPIAPTRVTTKSFPTFGDLSHFEEARLYCDGSSREALRKLRVPAGPALLPDGSTVYADERWVGTGRTIYDNKQQPVKQYEPYFSTNRDFETEDALVKRGVTPILHYDPLGRGTRVDLPNGTHRAVQFSPWTEQTFDEIDTLDADVPWYQTRNALPATDLEHQAATQSFQIRNTPSTKHFDTLGRAIVTLDDAQDTAPYATQQELDLIGNALAVIDPRGLEVLVQTFDVAARPIEATSVDSGRTTTLLDAAGKPLLTWQGEGTDLVRTRHIYDRAERPTEVWVTDRFTPNEALRERVVYRDFAPGIATNNAFGRIAAELDGGGLLAIDYDFRGLTFRTTRYAIADKTERPDWSTAQTWTRDQALPTFLAATSLVVTRTHDALGRELTRTTSANGRNSGTVTRTLDVAGRLDTLTAIAPGNGTTPLAIIRGIAYDEKGQRKTVTHGHGVTTTYDYDPLTFRLTRKLLQRSNNQATLQDWRYTYDPVGNLTAIVDAHANLEFFAGNVALPERRFRYDSLYRLKHAHGREHAAQSQPDQTQVPAGLARPLTPNDRTQIVPYDEAYDYDPSNNLTRVTHSAAAPWTRDLMVDNATNQLLSTTVRNETTLYTYDKRGQLNALPHLLRMAHSHNGQLLWATRTKVTNATSQPTPVESPVYFAYDRRGQRIFKHAVNGSASNYATRLYTDGFDLYETSDGLVRETLDIGDDTGRIALIETRLDQPEQQVRHQHTDHQSSATLELDGNASVLTYEEHHPFGTTTLQLGTLPKRFHFTNQERDEETSLQYHHHRYYAPWLARWTTPDPSGLKDGTNRYQYVRSNPLIYSDSTGNAATRFWGIVRAVGGTAQLAAGVLLALNPTVPGASQAVALVAFVHGYSDMKAGIKQAVSNREENSDFHNLVAVPLKVAGVDSTKADRIGAGADFVGSFINPVGPIAQGPRFAYAVASTGQRVAAAEKLVAVAPALVSIGTHAGMAVHSMANGGDGAGGASSNKPNVEPSHPATTTSASTSPPVFYGENAESKLRSHWGDIGRLAKELGIEMPSKFKQAGTQIKAFIDLILAKGETRVGPYKPTGGGSFNALWTKYGNAIVVRSPEGKFISLFDASAGGQAKNFPRGQ